MTFFAQFTEGVVGTPENIFYRKKKKDKTKYRIIGRPNEPMEEVQKRILAYLEKIAPRFHSATAARGGLGSVRNGRSHIGNMLFLKIDLVNAYANTSGRRVCEFIAKRAKKYMPVDVKAPTADEWYTFLSKYTLMRNGGLIQGSKVSQLLLDWYCEMTMDRPIRRILYWYRTQYYSSAVDIKYWRYVDDMTFSTRQPTIPRRMRTAVRSVIAKAGYLENHFKTQLFDVTRGGTITITGTQVGAGGHFGLSRKKVKEMERMLDRALKEPLFHPEETAKHIEGKLRYLLDVVRGKAVLNALEARTIEMYRMWCERNGRDARWPTRVLARKWKKVRPGSKKS